VFDLTKGIRRWYRDLPITQKIYLPNLFIIGLLIVVSGLIATTFLSRMMIERITLNTRQSLDIIIQSMDSMLNDIETGASKIAGDTAVQTMLLNRNPGAGYIDFDGTEVGASIQEKVLYLKNFIDSVSVYAMDGRLVGASSLNRGRPPQLPLINASVVALVSETYARNVWIDSETRESFFGPSSLPGITMLRAVRLGNIGDAIGVLVVNINENIFSKLYSHLDYGRTGRFIVVNRSGTMVFPESADYGLYSEFFRKRYFDLYTDSDAKGSVTTFGKERFVVISNILDRLGWVIIGMVPLQELMDYGRRATWMIYLLGVICVAFELASAFWISHFISKPIAKLSQSMIDASEGDLQIRANAAAADEIGDLARSFNEMVARIENLMDQVYKDQQKQRELELIALQAQINPHFLYNSLESICALSQLNRNEDAFTLGKSLSLFYRGVLSGGHLLVGIDEELRTLKHYLTIQEIRYRDKFRCVFAVDDDVLAQRIIKLSLQPIVENSIYHGLKTVRRQGKLWIFGRRVDERTVRLCVVDNGKGMTKAEVSEVLRPRGDGDTSGGDAGDRSPPGGFGLHSVDQRLKLYFGDRYGVSMQSRPGYWTKVFVDVPFASEEAR